MLQIGTLDGQRFPITLHICLQSQQVPTTTERFTVIRFMVEGRTGQYIGGLRTAMIIVWQIDFPTRSGSGFQVRYLFLNLLWLYAGAWSSSHSWPLCELLLKKYRSATRLAWLFAQWVRIISRNKCMCVVEELGEGLIMTILTAIHHLPAQLQYAAVELLDISYIWGHAPIYIMMRRTISSDRYLRGYPRGYLKGTWGGIFRMQATIQYDVTMLYKKGILIKVNWVTRWFPPLCKVAFKLVY